MKNDTQASKGLGQAKGVKTTDTSMTNTPVPEDEIKQRILKDALVRSAVQRWVKFPDKPIKSSHQEIVEIGIDDLMVIIAEYTEGKIREARIDDLESLALISKKRDGVWIYDTILSRLTQLQQPKDREQQKGSKDE